MSKVLRKEEFRRDKKIKTALFGATGAVGQVFMWMLHDHPWFELTRVVASESREGKDYGSEVHWILPQEIPEEILSLEIASFNIEEMKEQGIQIVFSALPNHIAKEIEPRLIEAGFAVFSNASNYRYTENVPILIPEANMDQLNWIEKQGYPEKGFIITNANCSTTGLAVAMAPLRKFGIKDVIVSTYQSVSGAGHPGLSALDITGNVVPFIGGEEEKMRKEFRKILSVDVDIHPFCVRVPVMFGHLETVWVEFEQDVDLADIEKAW
ncbi:MAG: aspartate-semialdehyde dehydrogenase, partial [Spirochaetes bacterium]